MPSYATGYTNGGVPYRIAAYAHRNTFDYGTLLDGSDKGGYCPTTLRTCHHDPTFYIGNAVKFRSLGGILKMLISHGTGKNVR